MNTKLKGLVALGISGSIIIGEGLYYHYVMRTERKKRKKIDEFERVYFAAAQNGQERLMALVKAEPFDAKAFWRAWDEEAKFMSILRNQPMY
jgi:hypothetical protein